MSESPEPVTEPQSQGISLDELTAAFAQAMGVAPKPLAEAPQPAAEPGGTVGTAEEAAEPAPEAPAEDDACCPISPRSILEAMLFVGNRDGQPLSASRAAELMRGVEPDEIPALVDELNRRYAVNGCPYHLVSDVGGYRMTLRKAFHPLRNRFYGRVREARLSQAAVDVLAIVAYRQPLSADEIGQTRGKPSSHVLAHLVHRGLLRIERQATPRRTTRYYTTDRFLRLFGLRTLADLPQSEEPG